MPSGCIALALGSAAVIQGVIGLAPTEPNVRLSQDQHDAEHGLFNHFSIRDSVLAAEHGDADIGITATVPSLVQSLVSTDEGTTSEVAAGRRGGGGPDMASGSFKMMSSNRAGNSEEEEEEEEEEEGSLGESREVAANSIVATARDATKEVISKYSSKVTPKNKAKCAGDWQNQKTVQGTLDCEVNPAENNNSNKGSACLDNLATGKWWTRKANGKGFCYDFNRDSVYKGVVNICSKGGYKGVIAKAWVDHPALTSKSIGAFGIKRLMCSGSKCDVFKTGVCVKCPEEIFASKQQWKSTITERSIFMDCCVHGTTHSPRWRRRGAGGITRRRRRLQASDADKCPPGLKGGAFTSKDVSAELKPNYMCDGKDAERAAAHLKSK